MSSIWTKINCCFGLFLTFLIISLQYFTMIKHKIIRRECQCKRDGKAWSRGSGFPWQLWGEGRLCSRRHASKRQMENVKSPGGQSSSKLLNHFLRLSYVVLRILWLFWYVWKSVVIPPLTYANNHQEL